MAAKPVKVAFIADTAELRSSLSKSEAAMDSAADTASKAGGRIDAAFDSTAESADAVASKGAQAAGALSGLGGLVGGPFGAAMTAGGTAMQAFADAGDLVNVVTESAIVRKVKDTAVTIAKTAADKTAAVASKAWAGAQWLLNAALTANPIGLVVVAITALIGGLVLAYKHSDKFRAIVNAAFGSIEHVVKPIISWIATSIPAAFRAVAGAASAAMGKVKRVVSSVWNGVKAIITRGSDVIVGTVARLPSRLLALVGKFASVGKSIIGGFISGLKGGGNFVSGIAGNVWGALRGMLNGAIGRINSALEFSINTHIPGIGTVHINPPNIPRLAAGGIVTRPTVALIGEAGPEAVIPLSRSRGVVERQVSSKVVNVNFEQDPSLLAREIARVVRHEIEVALGG